MCVCVKRRKNLFRLEAKRQFCNVKKIVNFNVLIMISVWWYAKSPLSIKREMIRHMMNVTDDGIDVERLKLSTDNG